MQAQHISIDHAKSNKLFYVVAMVVPYRKSDGRCLLLKRSGKAAVHPGLFCVPGGKLEWQDLDLTHPTTIKGDVLNFDQILETLARRETKEEANIELQDTFYCIDNGAFVRPDGIPVVLIVFAGIYLRGEVKPEAGAFTDFTWATPEEARALQCIEGTVELMEKTVHRFSESPCS
ncbi:MAG: NUDIX domain-containing protein [Candidatus Kerfeldbacteria bacterium]|nr:NUDIX domain-containing protein [Candidatus Kerfeldbacteria bacterium]